MSAQRLARVLVCAVAACSSPNNGDGYVRSDRLFAKSCFDGAFDLGPNFYAAEPFQNTQRQRIQRGNDTIENSDGILVLIDDTARVRGEMLGRALRVGLPPDVRAPNTPLLVDPDPPLVHIAFYLNETCHGTNTVLYGLGGTITFAQLFDGDPNESTAEAKLTDAHFDIQVGDPRDQPAGGGMVPPERTSHVVGAFRFYFQRGQPGQPFPLTCSRQQQG